MTKSSSFDCLSEKNSVFVSLSYGILILLFLFCSACSKLGGVRGTVRDYLTGKPLSGVKVAVGGTNICAESDTEGKYAIAGVIPGTQKLEASKEGYIQVKTVEILIGARCTVEAKDILMLRVPPSDGLFTFDESSNSYQPLKPVEKVDMSMNGNILINDKNRTTNMLVGRSFPLIVKWYQSSVPITVSRLDFVPRSKTTITFINIKNPDRWVSRKRVRINTKRVCDSIFFIYLDNVPSGDYLIQTGGITGTVYDLKTVFDLPGTYCFLAKKLNEKFRFTTFFDPLIRSLVIANRFDDAIRFAERIHDKIDKACALSQIAAGYARCGDDCRSLFFYEKASKAFRDARTSGLTSSLYDDFLRTYIANLAAGKGLPEEKALFFVESIHHKDSKNMALEQISVELAKKGKVESGYAIARSIDDPYHKVRALCHIGVELAKTNKKNASDIFKEAIATASSVSSSKIQIRLKRVIAVNLAKTGKFKEALDISSSLPDGWHKVNALGNIAAQLAKQGKTEQSDKLFMNMEKLIASLKRPKEKLRCLGELSKCLAKAGKIQEAMGIFEKIRGSKTNDLSQFEKINILQWVIYEFARLGKGDEAISLASKLNSRKWRNVVLRDICKYLILSGNLGLEKESKYAKRIIMETRK